MLGSHDACHPRREITSPAECQAAARFLGLKQRVPIAKVLSKSQRNCWFYTHPNAFQVYFNLADPRVLGLIGEPKRHPLYKAICRGRNWSKEQLVWTVKPHVWTKWLFFSHPVHTLENKTRKEMTNELQCGKKRSCGPRMSLLQSDEKTNIS